MDTVLVVALVGLLMYMAFYHSKGLRKYLPSFLVSHRHGHSSYPRKYRRKGLRADYHDTTPLFFGGDRDTHGCIRSAGYSWNEELGACAQPWQNHRIN